MYPIEILLKNADISAEKNYPDGFHFFTQMQRLGNLVIAFTYVADSNR